MFGSYPKAPASFAEGQKRRALESRQSMTKALKEHRFEDALEHARTATAVDPNDVMLKEFIRLLEEKQALGETDDEDPEDLTARPATAAASDEESDDDDDEGETDDEGSESDEESEEDDPGVLRALERLRLAEPQNLGERQAQQQHQGQLITPAKRYALRASLSAGIKQLLLTELAKELASDDPLLRM